MMDNYKEFLVSSEDKGKRIDVYLFEQMNVCSDDKISRTLIQKLIESENVLVNGLTKDKNYRVSENEVIKTVIPVLLKLEVKPREMFLDILYEDKQLLVVNKPKGMVVHPAPGHIDDTLVNGILFHCADDLSGIGGVKRPGIVHRIDKDTSGLVVVAKNDKAHISLAKQLAKHSMLREYHAVCHGILKEKEGTINKPIGRDSKNRKKFAVDEKNGKIAITNYITLQNFEKYTYLSLNLFTGRTHQIRVHMSSIGHPLAGDLIYGPKSTPKELSGQCLHAKKLGFIHPETGEQINFDSELPEYFNSFLNKLSNGVVND